MAYRRGQGRTPVGATDCHSTTLPGRGAQQGRAAGRRVIGKKGTDIFSLIPEQRAKNFPKKYPQPKSKTHDHSGPGLLRLASRLWQTALGSRV